MAGRAIVETATDAAIGTLAGTWRITQESNVAASGAIPGEVGKTEGSSAGRLSITVRQVSTVVPCLA